ncbi:hypothetical protein [Mucilaginibacter gilvus]|uniref:Lipoprotein n=1 Tax=Mucilaginibacter gilvus TaxID=2305909 RepID=A0A444MN04_9SPHI|nr:hypothetical protein [Mucilaginibacter gilvus]RWY51079.1 hypothetical protein EPL05_13500 [Mucilaginibacter gilvus]
MKKEIVKMLALLLFGTVALSSCAIDNTRTHRRYNNDRHHDRKGDNNRDGYHNRDNNNNGSYNHSNY